MDLKEQMNEEKSNILDKIRGNPLLYPLFIALLPAGCILLNIFYTQAWENDCETFYGVPKKYFTTPINNKLVVIGIFLILVIGVFIPIIIKKSKKKFAGDSVYKKYLIAWVFTFGILLSSFNVLSLINIATFLQENMKIFESFLIWINRDCLISLMTISVPIIAIAFYTLLYVVKLEDKIQQLENKLSKKFIETLFVISFVVTAILCLYGIISPLFSSISYERNYEIATYLDDKYIVLSKFDNKVLIAKYTLNEHKNYTIWTKEYSTVDSDGLIFSQIKVRGTPEIIKD